MFDRFESGFPFAHPLSTEEKQAVAASLVLPDEESAAPLARVRVRLAEVVVPAPTRRAAPLRAILVAASLVIVLAASGVVVTRHGGDSLPPRPAAGIAYAQVSEAMHRIRTAHWVQTFTRTETKKEKGKRASSRTFKMVTECWLRIGDDFALYRHDLYQSNGQLADTLTDARGVTMRDRKRNTTFHLPVKRTRLSGDVKSLRANVEAQIEDPFARAPPSAGTPGGMKLFRITSRTKIFRQTDSAGRAAVIFHTPAGNTKNAASCTVWVDEKTRRVLRDEVAGLNIDFNNSTLTIHCVREHFRYDAVPPAGIFDWSVANNKAGK